MVGCKVISARVVARLTDGTSHAFVINLDVQKMEDVGARELRDRLLDYLANHQNSTHFTPKPLLSIEEIHFSENGIHNLGRAILVDEADTTQDVPQASAARCKTLLGVAYRILPPKAREDALDEWHDEIECAAAQGKPVWGRTLSIIFRALPVLALRTRFPIRARGGGS
jgi:hypothetical protein